MPFRLSLRRRTQILALSLAGILLLLFFYGLTISAQDLLPDFSQKFLSPSIAHPFGTDAVGRDIWLRTTKAATSSLSAALFAAMASGIIALLLGSVAAMGHKKLDQFICWIIDLVMGIPHLVLLILISFACGRGAKGLFFGIAFTHWPSLARLIRAQVLQLRTAPYLAISRRMGKSFFWILFHHILPHLICQSIVGIAVLFPHAILHEAALSFLGFGLPPESPAIGIILSESMGYLSRGVWWPAFLSGLFLFVMVLAFDLLGQCVRTMLSPHTAQE